MTPEKVHLYFEQSGTFKQEFIKLGIPAFDYDIQNNFGQTDFQIDLFREIQAAYNGEPSVIDRVNKEDLIIAFFPCIYFCENNALFFRGQHMTLRKKSIKERSDIIIERNNARAAYYNKLLQLATIADVRELRLIIENPAASTHYLKNNFPYEPKYVDRNRRMTGDYYKKPTQYWFINCEPTNKKSFQMQKEIKKITKVHGERNHICNTERSSITSDYARNFIADRIMGIKTDKTTPTLF